MSNKDRPGKSIAFYTDLETAKRLHELAKQEHRSVSNLITVLINKAAVLLQTKQSESK